MKINFASDNHSGIHPEVLKSISDVNYGHVNAYGYDDYTKQAIDKFKSILKNDIEVFFVFNGTGANVTALSAITNTFNSIICSEYSHIHVDECGAIEKIHGSKLITIPTSNGKITIEQIKQKLIRQDDEHFSQPKVISLTQSTEYGTLYTINEIKEITKFAHDNDMYVHVDGARISNAAASLQVSLKDLIVDTDIDVLSFGGTKNGLMMGEAVIFLNSKLAKNFKFIRKQNMQLASKMRFIAAQFSALLSNDLWLKNATHSNNMAKLLYEKIKDIPKIKITQEVEVNSVFAIIPKEYIQILQNEYYFYIWNDNTSEVRLMCTFDTKESDVLKFADLIKKTVI